MRYVYPCRCGAKLRIVPTRSSAGKQIGITCPQCKSVTETLLPLSIEFFDPSQSEIDEDSGGSWLDDVMDLIKGKPRSS